MTEALSDTDITQELPALSGWKKHKTRNAICKTFKFKDFKQCWSFMSQAALLAEKMNHHPEWLNAYNKVEVTLTTHDADGITTLDLHMAEKMNKYAEEI
jgi:4a-hydroxytetrahydrobiopterin dehydratase